MELQSMKDPLEQFISENHDSFDSFEPSESIWENIETPRRTIKINFVKSFSQVAAVGLIFVASYFFWEWQHNRNSGNNSSVVTLEQAFPELPEAEVYYSSQVSNKLQQIKKIAETQPEIIAEIMTDFNELDSIYGDLRNDLNDNAANEEIIDAMIENYRIKLEILEDLLIQFQQKNTPNEEDNQNRISI